MKKKILTALMLGLTILTCTACAQKSQIKENSNSNPQQLQILKSDLKLTQDQIMSQIKAEHLIQNNGYLDSDEVVSIITLDSPSVIDNYLASGYLTYKSINEYANSSKGRSDVRKIEKEQQELEDKLFEQNLIKKVEYRYSTILNGIAVKTTYKNFKKLDGIQNIKSTILSDTYNLPKASSTGGYSAVENVVEVYETGIYKSDSVSFTGNGTAVAVLDSGFDCSHTVFTNQPEKALYSKDYIESLIKTTDQTKILNAVKFTPSLKISDVYYSEKIPYAYDYADKDTDVNPYDSEHGTHVAGIIGGKDDVITGIAVNTQLVLMKVFPDLDAGGKTEDIIAALEDAVIIGVDAINMSLGSSCGFAREVDKEEVNAIYDKINESGISLITAASNSYSAGFGGEQGNTNFVTNPDSGTVGSPSTYDAALSVASISGVKSKYLVANGTQVLFYKESNAVTGKENDFFKELGIGKGESKEFEYVTVPGMGLKSNFNNLDLKGKIALVRRGSNTFEEKALYAKKAGAVACIIYNNIDGDILMSMGKTDHIPTISISKDDGTMLASKAKGTILVNYDNQAGPFMSDFSSWGPTPSLGLKPEITAHGGSIKSAIPGGGYDELSGTSMATPNLCGIVILIRQYLKEKYPDISSKELSELTNKLLMSTATIALNEEGNPYSPRKQGAGLASIRNAVNTPAYITVDGTDRTKLELGDDPKRLGKYEMVFNVANLSSETISYDLSVIGMTESVSTSDSKHVAEKAQILDGDTSYEVLESGELVNNTLTIAGNTSTKVKVTYSLSDSDKEMMNNLFPYGMYVEGFVKLKSNVTTEEQKIDLNVPFLAFYGDWTEAPMFDKTYFEVESEAHNGAIDDEDKLKADYYATTPYGSYFYNYLIPLGTYLYDIDESMYEAIPASEDHIAISNILGTIDGISAVYAGLLRNAKKMTFTVTDKLTGEVVHTHIDYNANKAYSVGGSPVPYYENLKFKSKELGLINNRQYEFKMVGELDYGDGGAENNVRNSFSFDFYLDDEAPVLKDVQYEKKYDKTLKKDRYYITMTVYDNQYVQSISPIIFTSSSSYTLLSDKPIPVYSERGKDATVRFEITDYLEDIFDDAIIPNALAFSIDDYALNSNIYLCQLPGTQGDFKFTKDGTMDGVDLVILSMYENEIIDVTKFLASSDKTSDVDKDYLNHLTWTSSNSTIAEVDKGQVKCLKPGRATITAREAYNGKQAVLIINVKERPDGNNKETNNVIDNIDDARLKSMRFSYFETIFAYSRAAQTSKIGSTGDRIFIDSLDELSFYPGEQIQLYHDFNPWYAESKYELTYSSTDPDVASVDENGVVKAYKEGTTIITLNAKGSRINASVTITIKNPFVIENRTLIAYKGLGGKVVIPDDEGILYIGAYAFCLYETDRTIELTEDDYDKNKIPASNTSITSVVIPEGVEEIQKYAFYNCPGLNEVVLPSSVKIVREYAFCKDAKLETINLDTVTVIGREAFKDCAKLNNINLPKIYAIGADAFTNCVSLETVDLTTLRNTGKQAFKGCTALTSVVLSPDTKLSYAMFVMSGLTSVDIYEQVEIPEFCFAKCDNLETVTINNDIINVGKGAFSDCPKLTNVKFNASVDRLDEQAFYNCTGLRTITLPNNEVSLGKNCFYKCKNLGAIGFAENTKLENLDGSFFHETDLTAFNVSNSNPYYASENGLLLNKEGTKVIFAAPAFFNNNSKLINSTYVLDSKYTVIGEGAFAGINFTKLEFTNKELVIEGYAFANSSTLTEVVLPAEGIASIGEYAFVNNSELKIINLENVKTIKKYAFSTTGLKEIVISSDAVCEEGAFYNSKVSKVTIGENAEFGFGAFQNCLSLKEVVMPEKGGVHFGKSCFAKDTLLETIDLSKTDEYIEDEAFYGCTSLKIAELNNVKRIGQYAFADCEVLSYLRMPIVEEIGEGAFTQYLVTGGAAQIMELILPETLKSIGTGAFASCLGLTEIVIPSGLTEVSEFAFAGCSKIQLVTLGSNVTKIGERAFMGCENLKEINLEKIEVIGGYAFAGCEKLESVNLAKVKTIEEAAFVKCYSLDELGEMNELEKVGQFAFQLVSVKKIIAPKLSIIEDGAFQMNSELVEFTFSKNLSKIGQLVFEECPNLAKYSYYVDDKETTDDGVINEYARLINGALYIVLPSNHLELKSIPAALNVTTFEVAEGTYRIDTYAGNSNKNIKVLVFPDSLKSIGNFAFYQYDNLIAVEFKSFTAPALEDAYAEKAALLESDPGYNLLHKYVNLFGYELYYYTFIDLVGKKEPIGFIIPDSKEIEGYDSIVYEGFFGKLENAEISDYEPMHKNMIKFIESAKQIEQLKKVLLTDEKLIDGALTAYNAIKQDPTKYGYTTEEWSHFAEVVIKAKAELKKLQFANASKAVKLLQTDIDALPEAFSIDLLAKLNDITVRLNNLSLSEKTLLDLTKYDSIVASYKQYVASIANDAAPLQNSSTATNVSKVSINVLSILALCALYVLKKRIHK